MAKGEGILGEYTYNLSLWIEHPDADLSDVPHKLGLPAHRIWKKGDVRTAPNGRVQGGTYKNSYCNIQFGERHSKDLSVGLRSALAILQPHKEYLEKLSVNGVELRLFVGWYSEFNSRDILDWKILHDMAALKISLDLDFYGPDPIKDRESQEQTPT